LMRLQMRMSYKYIALLLITWQETHTGCVQNR
jgi:hypothetical protein